MKSFYILILSLLLFQHTKSQSVKHAELLCRPTDQSITIQMVFQDSAEVRVEYGTSSANYSSNTAWQMFLPNQFNQLLLTNLQPSTQYYYRIAFRQPGSSTISYRNEHQFHTQRSSGETFTFTVQADPHLDEQSDSNVYRRCLQNQLHDKPDFMIDLGDFLMTDKLKNASNQVPFDTIPYRCRLLRSYYDSICHSVPLFITLGNHEGEAGWNLNGNANNIAVWNTNERKQYFPNPAPDGFYGGDTTSYLYVGQRQAYYSWNWGNALFIVLDPYWSTTIKPDSLHGWRWTLGKQQYDWLKSTLDASNADFKFVFIHHLVGGDPDGRGGIEFADKYEWGGQNLDGTNGWNTNRAGWYKPIKDLLTEHRVTVLFHGHDHFFGKQDKDCIVYQECPQPSHPNFNNISYATDYGYLNGQLLPNSGHIRVTVSSNGVLVQYIRAYIAASENSIRHNGDTSATYFIGSVNCYDSVQTGVPVLWNSDYMDELIYPNPFQDQTTLSFRINEASVMNLFIYNSQGAVIRKLLYNQPVDPGDYRIIWDGKDDSGAELANGTYFYQLTEQHTTISSGKLILNK